MYIHLFCYVPLDVLTQGNWKLLQELDNSQLKELASKLPNAILQSHVNNTVIKYLRAFKTWKTQGSSYNLQPLPVKPHQFVLYLQHLAEESR